MPTETRPGDARSDGDSERALSQLVSGAILNGGRATRFGGIDKGNLSVNGQTIRERQLDLMRRITDDVMIVGGSPSALNPQWSRSGQSGTARDEIRFVPDVMPGLGPLAGLHAALTAARRDLVVVVACDMPCVSEALVHHLIELAVSEEPPAAVGLGRILGSAPTATSQMVDAVVPKTGSDYHPLCAVYRRRCLPTVTRLLQEGRRAMRDLLSAVRVRDVDGTTMASRWSQESLLANLNTPADYDALCALLRHGR
jgi:molybdenum cofactor guanylyltransferase